MSPGLTRVQLGVMSYCRIDVIAQKMKSLRTDNIQGLVDWLQQNIKDWVEAHEPQKVAAEHQTKTLFESWRSYNKKD